jgi:hypothetical protein
MCRNWRSRFKKRSLLPNLQKSYVKEATLERMGKDEYQINDFFKAYVNEKVGPDSRLFGRPSELIYHDLKMVAVDPLRFV